ncbi:MAG: glycoside hydrolase family 43 protein [Cyclobacteriaceae bacterium]|mgnify:CR=1 FL=1
MNYQLVIWLLFLFILPPYSPYAQSITASDSVLMFSYFMGNGEDGLHLAYSEDGYRWTSLNNNESFLPPMVGEDKLMRDPCIINGPDGKFHMVWTVSWKERGIGYANSTDLVNWSEQTYIPVMEHEPSAKNCWAPELFYDKATQQYLIFWATTIPGRFPQTDNQSNNGPPASGNNHRMYYTTTKDFETFTNTKLFYERGFNVIDATVVEEKGRYVMFLKDETNKPFLPQKNIRLAFSTTATGPYSYPSQPISGEDWVEGPTVVKINNIWHLYFDRYRKKEYGLMTSPDLVAWEDQSVKLLYPKGMRHGTVFWASRSLLEKLPK